MSPRSRADARRPPRSDVGGRRPGPPAVPTRPAPARAPAPASGYEFQKEEKLAVEKYLRDNPNLRVATDADQRPAGENGDVSNLYGVYHPYFVRGDANDDGRLDFVLAFVRRDSDRDSPWFSVVVFEGRPDGTFAGGAVLERDISLADGDLSLDRDSIVVTPDTARTSRDATAGTCRASATSSCATRTTPPTYRPRPRLDEPGLGHSGGASSAAPPDVHVRGAAHDAGSRPGRARPRPVR